MPCTCTESIALSSAAAAACSPHLFRKRGLHLSTEYLVSTQVPLPRYLLSDGSSHLLSAQIESRGLAAFNVEPTAQFPQQHLSPGSFIASRTPTPLSAQVFGSDPICLFHLASPVPKSFRIIREICFRSSGSQRPKRDRPLTNLTLLFVFMQAWIPRSPPFPTSLC